MDVVTGAMRSLLTKLGELLEREYKLQKGVKEDVQSLEKEMKTMHAALIKVAEVPRDQLDRQVKSWADEVRELSYDMEDVVDNFLVCVEGSDPAANSHKLKWLMDKMASLFTTGKTRHQIFNAIRDIQNRAQAVADQRDRYKVGDVVANAASKNNTPDIDPRMLFLYKDPKDLVGIEGARDELTKRLTHGDGDVSNQHLKIVSIFGPGGLGKTTLAKAVYDSLQAQYEYKAFVPVGRNPDVKKVLKDILLQQGMAMGDIAALDAKQLIDELRDLLQNKRYFIVIDDIWDSDTWEIIKCALLDNNRGSRVITTTRILKVATYTGDVYQLEPLSHDLSEELFYRRLCHGKGKRPDQPSELSKKILQKCGGVPLAIIAIASLLLHKPEKDWSKAYTSIGFVYGDETKDIDNMRKILLFSYDDLPCDLRPCLLHLSIFPEDTLIMKDTLIWMWIAEGFVSEKPRLELFEIRGFVSEKTRLFEIGEGYFNDLVNRSMILPVGHKEENVIYACCVHDMVLDMICLLSKEQNFVTILDSNGEYSSQSNARRLAVQTRDEEQHNRLANTSMPKLRSYYYASMCHRSMMPPLSSFQVLRVLDLKNCRSMANCHLEHLGKLHQLRYLSLENTAISELPKGIGDLKFLQTLDLRNSWIKELPHGTSLLRKLKCLRVDSRRLRAGRVERDGIIAPNWIGNLTSLEELSLRITGEFSTFVEELGKLTELRVLVCHLKGDLNEGSKKNLVESVCHLENIQILRLKGLYGWSKADTYWKGYKPPRQLSDLYISSDFSSLPAWIDSSALPNLYKLKMSVYPMKKRDVVNLGGLPELLKLKYIWLPAGMEFPDGAFPKLRKCGIDAPFRFLPGSMQCLESITFGTMKHLQDAAIDFDFIGTLGNLPSLQVVSANIDCGGARASDVEKMEAAVRQAIDTHPNRPTLCLGRRGQDRMIKEPASPLHRTTSVGTSDQSIVIEDEDKTGQESHDDEASDSRKADRQPEDERKVFYYPEVDYFYFQRLYHNDDDNRVREEPDPEQRNQDQSHDDEASDSRKADRQPDDEHKGNDVDVDAAEKCSVLDVHPNRPVPCLSVGMSAPSPARTTTTGISTSTQAINKDEEEEEEEESQADRQEQPTNEREEAKDGSAEHAPESDEAAAAILAPVPARRMWRWWACFSCLNVGSSSSD